MDLAVQILTLVLKQVPELVKVIESWFDDSGDEQDPIYRQVSQALDGALEDLDKKLK